MANSLIRLNSLKIKTLVKLNKVFTILLKYGNILHLSKKGFALWN
jgi:hypothetical protein